MTTREELNSKLIEAQAQISAMPTSVLIEAFDTLANRITADGGPLVSNVTDIAALEAIKELSKRPSIEILEYFFPEFRVLQILYPTILEE